MTYRFISYFLLLLFSATFSRAAFSQTPGSAAYDIGSPVLTNLWVDPVTGDDDNSGLSRGAALKTVSAAWNKIPIRTTLNTTGYRIMLGAGTYDDSVLPNYWESRYGTFQFPIILQSADGRGKAKFTRDINAFELKYFYLIDFDIVPNPATDVLHFEQSDHILILNMFLDGAGQGTRGARENIKFNQSQYVYIESSNVTGSNENAIDFVAVQYGHILNNIIKSADDWCIYLKGGSAYFLLEGNEIYDCGTGGFVAGQGTGFEYMTAPWIHYEAYDLKFVNNLVHDTVGAGVGVNGGYNILFAHNTLYKVGSRSHGIELAYGLRSCDESAQKCAANLALGGWGKGIVSDVGEPIPNRNVKILNNILYNPTGFRSADQHFTIQGPQTPADTSNIPSPAVTDANLEIKGNIIWNGPASLPLGVEDSSNGCQSSNSSCNETQLLNDNQINTVEPQLTNPATGDFRPLSGGNVEGDGVISMSAFPGGDRVITPLAPEGILVNVVQVDRSGSSRIAINSKGAYASSASSIGGSAPTAPGEGGGTSPSGDTVAPKVKIQSSSAIRNNKNVSVSIKATLTDNVGISSARVSVHVAGNSEILSFLLKRKGNSNNYHGKGTAKNVSAKTKKFKAVIMAADAAGNAATKSKSVSF